MKHSVKNNSRQIEVAINKNIELLGFAYFLGYEGNELESKEEFTSNKISKKEWYGYGFNVYQKYKPYAGSKNLAVIIHFAEDIWLDYLGNLLIQLDNFPNAKMKEEIIVSDYIRFSKNKDSAQARNHVSVFITAFNELYKEVDFDNYMATNKKKYENALLQVRNKMPDQHFVAEMEKFYQKKFDRYTLLPSLTIPTGMGFGLRYTLEGNTSIFNLFGPFTVQQFKDETNLDMGFNSEDRLREKSTHEFGHSFVNPVIDNLSKKLMEETKSLYEPIKKAMSDQAYTNWKICLYEHFVRAGEIMIARNLNKKREAESLLADYVENRKFIYLPVIIEELERYNDSRIISYPETIQSIMERFILKTKSNL